MECVAIFGAVSPNRNFPKRYNFVLPGYGTGKGRKGKATSVGVICEGMEKVRRKMGIRGDTRANLGWEAASIGLALVGRGMPRKIRARGV